MADTDDFIPEADPSSPEYPTGITMIKVGDAVKGGMDGIVNKQAQQLAKRTQLLYLSLIQMTQMYNQLPFSMVTYDISPEGGGVGGIISQLGITVWVTRETEDTYQVSLYTNDDTIIADIYARRYGTSVYSAVKKEGFSISTTMNNPIFDAPISFDDQVDLEIIVDADHAYIAKIRSSAKGARTSIIIQNISIVNPSAAGT